MTVRWALVLCAVGCTREPLFGPPTGATCPPDSTLTYETFAMPFMTRYCTKCHSSDLVGDQRHGAPSFHDFDTRFGIKAVADHIDETTAAGPEATNEGMPPESPYPTLEERRALGEWLACGLP